MKLKLFGDHNAAAEKLFQDVGTNNVRIYQVDEYERIAQLPVHPPSLTKKWSQVVVAASGDLSSHRDWMVVAPYRADVSKKTSEKCIDLDPVLLVLDSDLGLPHPSGAVAYHQTFPDRTTNIPGFEKVDLKATVADLRTRVIAGIGPLETAPPQVLSALHHMVGKFRADFTDEGE